MKELLFFLVDDDPDDQEFFISALEDINPRIKCIIANNGCEALQLIKKDENFLPDFIFLNLNMPKVNGKECLVELRKTGRFKEHPIYIYTTSSTYTDKTDALKLGATDFITKPSTIKDLTKVLSDVISNSFKEVKVSNPLTRDQL